MAEDGDIGLRIQLIQASRNLAHRNVQRIWKRRCRDFMCFANVEQDESSPARAPLRELLNGKFFHWIYVFSIAMRFCIGLEAFA